MSEISLLEMIESERYSLGMAFRKETEKSIADSPDYQRLAPHVDVLRSQVLSHGIKTRKDLEAFVANLEGRDPIPDKRRKKGFFNTLAGEIDLIIFDIFRHYGVPSETTDAISMQAEFNYPESEEATRRVLPNTYGKAELVNRITTMIQTLEHRGTYDGHVAYSDRIFSGFDDWKAAVVFASYSHRWVIRRDLSDGKTRLKLYSSLFTVRKNHQRYLRFGLTSEKAVRAAKPGALFTVENVFGSFAPSYVASDIDKFKELLRYSQIKGAKDIFQNQAGGDYAKFKAIVQ